MLAYAIVVATRNRLSALRISIPLFLEQRARPARIVVVDCSDDHAAVRAFCLSLSADTPVPIEVIQSDAANLANQRNRGTERVKEPIVMFPDDDAFWFSDTAEKVLAVYAHDSHELIGGVTAIEVEHSPVETGEVVPRKAVRFVEQRHVHRIRNVIEDKLFPEPFHTYGRLRTAILEKRARALGIGVPFVPTMGGYRMSFRTEVARDLRFDETLGSRVGYSQHEDKDISLRTLKTGRLLAVAPGARVHHHVFPGRRAGGFAYGFCHIFNYAYICFKVFGDDPNAISGLKRYCEYKKFLYGLRRASRYHREIAQGAKAAMQEYHQLARAGREDLAFVYGEASDRWLK